VNVQCIYAVTKRVVFAVDEEKILEGTELLDTVLELHLCYFAELEDAIGLIEYVEEDGSPWAQYFSMVANDFGKENPRRPFALWEGVEPVFKDLAGSMCKVDPRRRITAKEALNHEWFNEVE
jgi:serine/threonine protein kinase